jgi:DNA (cytosine-5)-methyltransferase 1
MRSSLQSDLHDILDGAPAQLREQTALLRECLNNNIPVEEALNSHGKKYSDLRYANNKTPISNSPAPLGLEDFFVKGHSIPVVSFFSGGGGVDLGFESVGFEHVALIEHNEVFCNTLKKNRPHWPVYGPPNHGGDVSKGEDIKCLLKSAIGHSKKFEGVFVGGPPCQPFSIAANQRFHKSGENFKRIGFEHKANGNLLFDFIEQVIEFSPKVFMIENVVGLADVDGGIQLKKAYKKLESAGYSVNQPLILNAEAYGIPQRRRRMFIIGTRINRPFQEPVRHSCQIPCWSALNQLSHNLENHTPRKHKIESVIRYINLDYGQRDKLGRVDRLDPDLPSKTVIAGGVSGGGRSHLHPKIPRTLTVRESARLQGFPDDYIFTGPSARQFTQVGNAVPPVLAAQLATSIRSSYYD